MIGVLVAFPVMGWVIALAYLGCRGHRLVVLGIPFGVAAAGVLALYNGGWDAVWEGVVPFTVLGVLLGG